MHSFNYINIENTTKMTVSTKLSTFKLVPFKKNNGYAAIIL